jgi:hypothetical protein
MGDRMGRDLWTHFQKVSHPGQVRVRSRLVREMGDFVGENAGRRAAIGFWAAFGRDGFKPNRAVLNALRTGIPGFLASPVGLAGAALGVIFLGAFASAILGGAGLALVGGAIIGLGALGAAAAQQTKDAWINTGQVIKKSFQDSALGLVAPVTRAADQVSSAFAKRIAPQLQEMFTSIAPAIGPLTDSLLDAAGRFAEAIAPNIENLVPTLIEIGEQLPGLAEDTARFVNILIDNGPEIAEAFGGALDVIGDLVVFLGHAIAVGSKIFNFFSGIKSFMTDSDVARFFTGGPLLSLLSKPFGGPDLIDIFTAKGSKLEGVENVFKKVKDSADGIVPSMMNVSDATGIAGMQMGKAAEAAGGLSAALELLNGGTLSARDAERAFQAAIDDADASLEKHGKTLDVNTEAGRDNQAALDAIAKSAMDAADAEFALTGSTDAATAKLMEGREALIAAGIAMGMSRKEAEALADQILKIPTEWGTQYKNNLAAQAGPIAAYIRQIEGIPKSKTVTITTRFVNQFLVDQFGVNAPTANRYGGLYMAADGLLSTSRMFPASNRTLFGFREPDTGGEAFIARNAPRERSLDIAAQAAAWHNAAVVPLERMAQLAAGSAGDGGRDGRTVVVNVQIGDEVVRVVEIKLDEHDQEIVRQYGAGVGAA